MFIVMLALPFFDMELESATLSHIFLLLDFDNMCVIGFQYNTGDGQSNFEINKESNHQFY